MPSSDSPSTPRLPGEGSRQISFTIPVRVFDWANEEARSRNISVSEFMRQLLASERRRVDEDSETPSYGSVTWPDITTGT